MRLKTLEIKGFKSFADKTLINFSEEVIGVVGSNGCGKSNVVDAIKWVLGEQKTSALRSDSMTNVIFNGTKSRNAAGMAEVSLIFDNNQQLLPAEYTEVGIKRVLYKDGTGEYYLNGVKCRLKDIQSLLSDTGISADSYAIIALSMVDDLLADKDNARLGLFEQAAGVGRYKVRKKETLAKLKTVDEDLARVEDLLSEIDKNLQSLEKQAARTKKYLQIKEEYKTHSLAYAHIQTAQQNSQLQQLNEQLERENSTLADTETQRLELERLLAECKSRHGQEEHILSEQQRLFSQLIGRIKGKENDIKIIQQKQQFNQESTRKQLQQSEEAKAKIAHFSSLISTEKQRLEQEKQTEAQQEAQLQQAAKILQEARNQHQQLKGELDTYIKANSLAQNQLFELEKQLVLLQSKKEQSEQSIAQINGLIQQKKEESSRFASEITGIETRIQDSISQLETLKSQEADRLQRLETTYNELETCKEQLATTNRLFDAKENEHKLLKSLVESLEGFSESVKFLSKQQQWATKAVLFSDIIYCEADYRVAIENYLDAYLSYYVVADVAEAVAAIRMLDEHKKGKANFFIRSQVQAVDTFCELQPHEKLALQVVKTSPSYQPLVDNLLAKVVLVDNETQIPAYSPDKIYLSKDGRFSQRAYHIKGGSVGAFEGKKIGRKQNLELLASELQKLETEKNNLKSKKENLLSTAQTLKSSSQEKEISKLNNLLTELQKQQAIQKSKMEGFQTQIADYQRSIQAHEQKKAENSQLIAQLSEDIRGKKSALAAQQQLFTDKESSFKQIAEDLGQKSNSYNLQNVELVKQQNRTSSLQKELDFASRQLQDWQHTAQQSATALAQSEQEKTQLQQQLSQAEQEIAQLQQLKQDAQQKQEELDKAYFQLKGRLNELDEQLRANQKKQQLSTQISNQLHLKCAELKMQIQSVTERIRVEFELDLADWQPDPASQQLIQAPQGIEEKMQKLRSKVQNFGAVNYMAVEAYEETKTRHDFISSQRDDLLAAKETLLTTLREVESVAVKLFMEAFTSVRTHFISVFRSLFEQDDTCDLVLTDVQNPLESKIEIIARPKGKKPLTINQLSGGEKTLTATALLFALYLLKPAPFCIFDEVDAPLDDANIAKFNHIIRDFSSKSQFIIVTHNKKTMEQVNILYGVTMVQGVSRVVPVDFRQL